MVTTAHSTISAATIIKGTPITIVANPASTYKPADAVYMTALAIATHLDSDTAIAKLIKPAFLDYLPRKLAGVTKGPDDAYAATETLQVIIGGLHGPLKLVIKVTDLGATIQQGHAFMASATAGDVALAASTGTNDLIDPPLYLAVPGVNGDTYATGWMY